MLSVELSPRPVARSPPGSWARTATQSWKLVQNALIEEARVDGLEATAGPLLAVQPVAARPASTTPRKRVLLMITAARSQDERCFATQVDGLSGARRGGSPRSGGRPVVNRHLPS